MTPGDGAPLLGKPCNSSRLLGDILFSLSPRTTQYTAGRISLATTEPRITSYPAWPLSWLPNRCQLSPCRLPSPLVSGGWRGTAGGAASTRSLAPCAGADTRCPRLPRGLPHRDLSCIAESAPAAPEGGLESRQREWPLAPWRSPDPGPGPLTPQLPCVRPSLSFLSVGLALTLSRPGPGPSRPLGEGHLSLPFSPRDWASYLTGRVSCSVSSHESSCPSFRARRDLRDDHTVPLSPSKASTWCLPWVLPLWNHGAQNRKTLQRSQQAPPTASRRLARLPVPFAGEAASTASSTVSALLPALSGPGLRAPVRPFPSRQREPGPDKAAKGKKNRRPGSQMAIDIHHTCAMQRY